ncbi:MAG: hydroxyacylglutathione hydrolase [Candidatus Accumulibacter sp.]|jgi:hydroxyacylglutathione hydrolase|nr:hydroxyacylglutathione hydrolase [Accumulibacter sp.]
MFDITCIPALKDNYIWLLHKGRTAIVVDPGEAFPVEEALSREKLSLRAVLITHAHADHQGGVAELIAMRPLEVFGPAAESITAMTRPLQGGEAIDPDWDGGELKVIFVPGHTRAHLAYYGGGCLFCGDTLFAGGCGRVFEGTPEQMFDSLERLALLPDETAVYCAHEYTEANLRFAMAVEPGNRLLRARVNEVAVARAKGWATLPTTLTVEKATNPFLRCDSPEVVASAVRRMGPESLEKFRHFPDPRIVFSVLRAWKNEFR